MFCTRGGEMVDLVAMVGVIAVSVVIFGLVALWRHLAGSAWEAALRGHPERHVSPGLVPLRVDGRSSSTGRH